VATSNSLGNVCQSGSVPELGAAVIDGACEQVVAGINYKIQFSVPLTCDGSYVGFGSATADVFQPLGADAKLEVKPFTTVFSLTQMRVVRVAGSASQR